MAGNTFGKILSITTFGESHGPALGVVIDGVPPRIPLSPDDIQQELNRRRPGQSAITTPRQENDEIEILSGLFEGKTTGTPLALLLRNRNQRSQDYEALKQILRPGHADFTYLAKYGIRDPRGGGRSSGRETAARVAAGAVAKKVLKTLGIRMYAYTHSIGDISATGVDLSVIEKNPVRAADLTAADKMLAVIEQARQEGDSVGGIIEAVVKGCPPGWGEPVFDKINAKIAHALLSIGAIRGIEFGAGFAAAKMKGSQHNDPFIVHDGHIRTASNNAGGILGGLTNGGDILLRVAVKPTSSISQDQTTVTVDKQKITTGIQGRHDPCLCPRLVPVVEAMLAICLLDSHLIQQTVTGNPDAS